MAFNPAPTQLIPSISEDGTTLSFPLASVPGLTAANCDATTGDWRDIVLFFVENVFNHYAGLAAANKPGRLSITRQRVDGQTSMRYQYNLVISAESTLGEVIAE
jgi:hypothetical protein